MILADIAAGASVDSNHLPGLFGMWRNTDGKPVHVNPHGLPEAARNQNQFALPPYSNKRSKGNPASPSNSMLLDCVDAKTVSLA